MWQRIQTLYMILAALVALVVALLFPMYTLQGNANMASDNPVILLLFGFITGALIANVFNYKKRSLQIVLNRLVLVACVILIAFMGWDMANQATENVGVGPTIFVPIVSMILIVLANKKIAKDEALIRSSDRIR